MRPVALLSIGILAPVPSGCSDTPAIVVDGARSPVPASARKVAPVGTVDR